MEKQFLGSVIAVDLGGTSILLGEVTVEGEVIRTKSYPSDTTSQAIALQHIIDAIADFKKTSTSRSEPLAIGIGVVGRVDGTRGVWLEIEPGKSEETDVKSIIESTFGVRCGIDNDVACATKAEQRFGWGEQSDNFIYLNIGTGIAAGFIVDGHYVNGASLNSGEVGHVVVDLHSDVVCGCGRKGCVERIASGLGFHERVLALRSQYPNSALVIRDGERVATQTIFAGAESGDELCVRVCEDAASATAALVMNLVRVSDPDTIVLGGGVTKSDYFVGGVNSYLNPKTMRFVARSLVKTKLPEPGLVGAALAGMQAIGIIGEGATIYGC
ncbi:ROK family protein [Paenibacillus aceris]|uniref:NBD/HSP70 family sugar kinase n=1 Tax=Paenibacillus aceris TaxID=869555 RepID=A0ABS4HXK0_9BACL|nr:ROK family protein [Paenibacillus aceris]MBP1963215.1 putative NBD/HSP70 family sugar kinase [Paenibacillus aceris]NHW38669.1 ROK family protein [Paenibacillus aceris]